MKTRFLLIFALGMLLLSFGKAAHTSAQQPDTDGDGITDENDYCPNDYAPDDPMGMGCPDSDQDGINDYFDACPYDYAPDSSDGCPVGSEIITRTQAPTQAPTQPPPQPPQDNRDSDGDTVPDTQDVCPQAAGFPEWGGCPDTDGDGLTTQYDNCPDQAGPRENGGCPTGQQPPSNPPSFTMPTTGPCVIATLGNAVNVRSLPVIDPNNIVTQIQPNTLYNVIGMANMSDGVWYQINLGWVAGYVLQTGGDCSNVQTTYNPSQLPQPPQQQPPQQTEPPPQPPQPSGPVNLAPSDIDLSVALAACPQLILDAQQLPIFIQVDLASGNIGVPCDYLQELLSQLVFGGEGQQLSPENVNAILQNCPSVLPALTAAMDTLLTLNSNAWSILDSVMTPDNACQLATAIASQQIPPEFANALAGQASTPAPTAGLMLVDFRSGPPASTLEAPASAALIDLAISVCSPGITLDRATAIRTRMLNMAVEDTDILAAPCVMVNIFSLAGDLDTGGQALFNRMRTDCALDFPTSYGLALLGQANGVNIPAVMAIDTATFCANPLAAMAANLLDPTTDPNVAGNMAVACPGVAYTLKSYESELSLLELWIILSSPTPCALATQFINTGVLTPADQTFPTPACFNVPANTVALADGKTLTGLSPWSDKIAVLSRPPANICDGVTLPPADTDGDGNPDTTDACPAVFGLGPDGCPPGNTAPTIAPIANQTMSTGTFINVGINATDAEADPITLGATSDNAGIANVALAGNVMTITGVAAGTANITVTAADPTHAPVAIVFQVAVSTPPAPNNAPTIGAIPAQTVAVGASINVNVTANDADGDPLVFSAVLADGTLATPSFAGNVLTLTGKKAGTTQVTVIVGDGKTTVSTSFNLTVTGGAAPPSPGTSGGQNNLVSQGTQNPPRQDLAQYGLLTLPQPGQNIAAVFQATAGQGQQVAIYVLTGDQYRQLFEGATESNLFPTLDPNGELIAFLTVDAQGGVTLRVHRLEQNVSLPLLTGTPQLSIGLYPPAWSPDGKQILLTMVDANGVMGIYSLKIGDPLNIPPPELVAPNASTAAFAPNGHYIAFEQIGPNGERNIYVMAVNKPSSIHAVTMQTAGSDCTEPMFGADSLALFFTCMVNGQPQIFRYDLQGVNQLNLGVAMAENPAPGPGNGFLGFDDGNTIYYGYDDGSNVAAMLRLQNLNASNIRWTTLADIQ